MGERLTAQFAPEPEAPRQGGLFGNERGSVDLSGIAQDAQKHFGAEGPKLNYSGLGAQEDIFIRNLSQIEKADPVSYAAAVRAASSKGQTAVLLRGAVPRIEAALGPDVTWKELRAALVESRLQRILPRR